MACWPQLPTPPLLPCPLQSLVLEGCVIEPHILPSLLCNNPSCPDHLVLGPTCVGLTPVMLSAVLAAAGRQRAPSRVARPIRVEVVKGLLPTPQLQALVSQAGFVNGSGASLVVREAL